MIRILLSLGLVLLLTNPVSAQSSEPSIRVGVPVGLVRSGETFATQIFLDSDGIRINAAEIVLQYSPHAVEVIYVTREQSLFTLWPEPPTWSETTGEIRMTGGRPGGIFAVNASVATIYFRAKETGPISLTFDRDKTAAYRHDGQGTRLSLTPLVGSLQIGSDLIPGLTLISITHPTPEYWAHGTTAHVGWEVEGETEYSYAFSTDPQGVPDEIPETVVGSVEFSDLVDGVYYFTIKQHARNQPWSAVLQRRFLIDGTPPEPFGLQVLEPASVGQTRLIGWNAIDRTSGIVTYRLMVGNRYQGDVLSPLRLKAEWIGQAITIVAVDAAGHTKASEPLVTNVRQSLVWPWWAIGLLGVIVVALAIWMTRRLIASR